MARTRGTGGGVGARPYAEGLCNLRDLARARTVPWIANQGVAAGHHDGILHENAVREGLVGGELWAGAGGGPAPHGPAWGNVGAPITPLGRILRKVST